MSIGDKIRHEREKKSLTQDELGRLLNVSDATVNRYEKNQRKPDPDTLGRLADIFEVSTDYILGRTNDPHPASLAADLKTEEAERRIDEALAEDADPDSPELQEFWHELKKRPDLFLLFKQVRPMSNDSIRRAIRIIKAIDEEEQDERDK